MLKNSFNVLLIVVLLAVSLLMLSMTGLCEEQSNGGYRLGPEDLVKISILAGGIEQVVKEMVVSETGDLNVPFVGKIPAAGLTLSQLEKRIFIPLERDYFVDPQIHLQIVEYHSLEFSISGAVKNPGKFELDFTPTVMDLIANAGGVLPGRGNLAYILKGVGHDTLSDSEIHEAISKSTLVKIDLNRLLDEGDMSENIRLVSGDTVYIPLGSKLDQAATMVYVQGKVKSPGIFDYQPGLTALGACIMAGGFDKFAAPNRAKVIRKTADGQETIKINLKKVQTGDKADILLKPGDRIHIPESWL
nr:SLBB domain-containing protein [uncultured Desulfobacter sp.]